MSESTPLIKRSRDEEEGVVYEEYEEYEMSPQVKYSLLTLGVLSSLAVLYFFTVFLPEYFIPESTDLVDIIKVSEAKIELIPLKPTKKTGFELFAEDEDDQLQINEMQLEFPEDFSYEYEDSKTKGHKRKVERLILIGDIHGHYIQFRNLLRKLKYNAKKDHIIVLGDFVSKGPDSVKVLDYLMKNKIDCILGNHEYYVLQNYASFHGKQFPDFVNGSVHSEQLTTKGFNDDPEFLLAKKLEADHIKYINSCPIIKKIGDVPLYRKKDADEILNGGVSTTRTRNGVVVHGGLRWDLSLYEQQPVDNLEMRSLIGPYFNQSTDDPHEPNAVSWSKIWNKQQKLLKADESLVVYYGHDARRGLNLKNYARGLDTGCDRGDMLLAMVLWDELQDGVVTHREKAVQVHC